MLNQFNTYTYNISIHICHPEYTQDFDNAVKKQKTELIVDDTQHAHYAIQSLEQVFIPSYSKGSRAALANTFEIQIFESNSVTLLETIVQAAQKLGIKNHTQAAYFIKIAFKGRTPTANKPKKRTPVFYFPVIFRAFEISVTDSGAEYNISAVDTGAAGFSYLEGVIKSAIEIEAADFGEFIIELEKKINKSGADLVETDPQALHANTYEITFDETADKWKGWKFEQAVTDSKIGISTGSDGKLSFYAPSGTDLADFIGLGLSCTEEYKQIPTSDGGSVRPDGSGEFSNEAITKVKTFYKIAADVTASKWDPLRNDYSKKIQFKIMAYKKPSQVIDIAEQTDVTDATKQKTRAKKLFDEGLLRKRYDYLFTGLNTDVINLDVKFDYAYYVVSPIGGGKFGDAKIARLAAHDETVKTADERFSKAKSDYASAIRNISDLRSQYRVTTDATVDISLSGTERAARENNREIELKQIQRKISTQESQLGDLAAEVQRASDALNESVSGTTSSQQELLDMSNEKSASNSTNAPIRFHNDVVSTADTWGVESARDGGSIMFGAVKTNLESASDMMTIDIDIKGDPFWMGKPNTFRNLNTTSNSSDSDLADYDAGENMFMLNVNFPVNIGRGGRRTPRPDYSISGVYSVINVINRFQEGLFTQNIRAVRDTLTNVGSNPKEF